MILILFSTASFAMGNAPKKEKYKLEVLKMEVIPTAESPTSNSAVQEIKISAKRFSYTPSIIEVKYGIPVRLILTSEDVTHGFRLEAFNINNKINPAETAIVEFTPDKTGEFDFYCNNFCGLGHPGMRGKLIVK